MSIQDEIPRSRINLRYRTTIKGASELLELPFRVLILSDLSQGTSVDRETDLESRRLRSLDGKNLDSIMADMRMSLRFNVENCIDEPAVDATGEDDEDTLTVDLPITSRKSFNPVQVAANVPKIRALLLLRKLLMEMQSNIDNRKDLRRIIHEIFAHPEMIDSLKQELHPYAQYQIPNPKALAATSKPASTGE